MKENEFDIQLRNALQDAAESVSPKVWEGVAAGLDRKRRIVAFRRWGRVAGVAAAAAVAALFFLRPTAQPLQQEHSNPIISITKAPVTVEESLPVTEVEPQKFVEPQNRLAQAAPTAPAALVAPAAAPVSEPVSEPVTEPVSEAVSEQVPVSTEDRARLQELLLSEPSRTASSRGFSLSASGNVQDKMRNQVPGMIRPYSAPPSDAAEGIYNESPEVGFGMPFSAGIGLNYRFNDHWSLGVGVRYTHLSRTFVGDYVGVGFRYLQTDIDNYQHWVGVPLQAFYDIVNRGPFLVHAFAGGGMEFLVSNDYLIHSPQQKDIHYQKTSRTPQFSVAAGLGAEWRVTPALGIYLDPSLRYYFRTDLQPRSLRTIQPLRFDLELGLRFYLGK